MEKDIQINCCATNSNHQRRSSKPVQYFTFGKDNCLVHHPTSQTKKSSPSAVFVRTNPFQTQSSKINHRKVKSTFLNPRAHDRYTPVSNIHQQTAISNLAKNLKHVKAASSPNSNFHSLIIEGKSIKLNPRKNTDHSISGASTYCKSIKRCKMCGKVMLDLDSLFTPVAKHCSSIDSCSDCESNEIASDVDCEEKIRKVSHEHNPKIKRCVLCSNLFIQPYDSRYCKMCPNTARIKGKESNFSTRLKNTIRDKEQTSSSKTIPQKVVTSISIDGLSNKNANYKAFQSVKSDKLPAKPNDGVNEIAQLNTLIREQSKKNTNIVNMKISDAESKMPTQTKSVFETNRLTTKSKYPTKKITLESDLDQEQLKRTNMTSKTTQGKKSTINSIAKSLSEANKVSLRSTNSTELPSKSYLNKKQSDHMNKSSSKTLSKTPNIPSQSRSLPQTKRSVFKSRSVTEELASKSYFSKDKSKNINIENGRISTEMSKVPIQIQSLPEMNQHFSKAKNSSEELMSEICIDREECSTVNMSDNLASTKNTNVLLQNEVLIEIDSSASKTRAEEECIEEIYIDKQEIPNTNNSISTKDSSIQTQSLSKTNQISSQSKHSSESFIDSEYSQNPNVANKGTSTVKFKETTQTKILSQLEQDFLSKYAYILDHNKGIYNNVEERPLSPILQNVTVNNYYFLTESDLKKALGDSSVTNSFSRAKQSSSESVSLISETEDELEGDQIKRDQNGSIVNSESSNTTLSQSHLRKSVLEELCGVSKINSDNFSHNSCQSLRDISLDGVTCSTSKSDLCPKIDQFSVNSKNLYQGISKQDTKLKKFNWTVNNKFCTYNQDVQSLYGIKSINPFMQKALQIFEEMERVKNEQIDPDKILKELEKNEQLMKLIDQMAAQKLNFPRKATVFKNLTSK